MTNFEDNKPLSNFDIIKITEQLHIPNFKGVFMRDEILNENLRSNECFVYNIDSKENPGTHWTCAFIQNNKCWYFDSYGFQPPKEFLEYTENIENRWYSNFKIQTAYEVICGHYCLYVLYYLSRGIPYYTILDKLYYYNN